MALLLPRVFIPHDRSAAVEVSRAGAVDAEEIAFLEGSAPADTLLSEHHLPLKRGRWAVGRTGPEGTLWRIGGAQDRERLFHPAWLWRDDDAFDQEGDDNAHVAPALPLRVLIRDAMPLFGNAYNTCACVAATIAALRRRKRPVAVVPVWQEDPADHGVAARSFALCILTTLPIAWRTRLRVSTLQVAPSPNAWDLVFVTQEARGFGHVHAEAPASVESDIVASYILDRLLHKDPEAVEACAYFVRESQEGGDPWADGVRAHLAGGVPGVSSLGDEQLDEDPVGAVQAVCRRLEAGAAVKGSALSDLAAVTARTQDPKPWKLLAKRPEGERATALLGVLPHLDAATITPELCVAMNPCGLGGAAAGEWAAFLIDVLRQAEDPAAPLELLSNVVGNRNVALDATTRASLWQEVTVALVERHEATLASQEMLSANGRRIAAEGGITIVHSFLALPVATRTPGALRAVIDALANADDADHAVAQL